MEMYRWYVLLSNYVIRAMHGLYRSIIANMVKGVTDGYTRKLELVGVGYKAVNQGNILDLVVGLFT
jgi:large subunit ribosomal protein L6